MEQSRAVVAMMRTVAVITEATCYPRATEQKGNVYWLISTNIVQARTHARTRLGNGNASAMFHQHQRCVSDLEVL